MEEYKGTAWELFKNTVENKTEDVIALGFFRDAIVKAVADQVSECLPIDAQENANNSCLHGKSNSISEWIDEFVKHNFKSPDLPLSNDVFVHVRDRKISDLETFTSMLSDDLLAIENERSYSCSGKTKQGKYKNYKDHFPDWDIPPNSDVSKYWMWVMCRYKDQLTQMYDTDDPDIPENWWVISKEDALNSL
ncbi:unnamed protein product [Mytilus edulis]|uniref:Uncharacterized protein n=1 Tax=Mytilus edulis TaxID=6550 RepID=A0A8S3UH97_MYTED|nr:unnamed protein product [Mytilus edulis]